MTTKPFPFDYDYGAPLAFGGAMPVTRSFEESKAVVFPVPLDRTTSYVAGTRNGPHEILQASSHMELWDEELGARHPLRRHLHAAGDGIPVRRAGSGDGGDPASRLGNPRARQVPRHARRRALDHAAAGGRGRRQVSRAVRAPDRRPRRPARYLHGHPAQPCLRHAAQPRSTRASRRSASAACRPRKRQTRRP